MAGVMAKQSHLSGANDVEKGVTGVNTCTLPFTSHLQVQTPRRARAERRSIVRLGTGCRRAGP